MACSRSSSWLTSRSRSVLQNKSLSDDTDEILRLQGIGWATRKVIQYATITLYVKHYKDDAAIEHIDIQQTVTGGVKGNFEQRTLIWETKAIDDPFYGPVGASFLLHTSTCVLTRVVQSPRVGVSSLKTLMMSG